MTGRYWEEKTLEEMDQAEWEGLCDGCARCCVVRLEDEDSGEVFETVMACDFLDLETCQCTDYPNRHKIMPDCVVFTPEKAAAFSWLPSTCAYRRLAEGRELPEWHPLITGDPMSVHEAEISVLGQVVHQRHVPEEEHEEMIIKWVEV